MLLIWCSIGAKIPRRANPRPVEEPVIAHEITYNLSILSLELLQKSARSRASEAVARFVLLSSDLTWDDVFAKLKIKISDVLFPRQAIVDEGAFEIFFSIPRLVPAPLPLVTEDDYKHLLRNVLKLRNDPAVKITVNQLVLVCCVRYIFVDVLKNYSSQINPNVLIRKTIL